MNLTRDNYYSTDANRAYYSVSQVKQFLSCQACAMAELRGEYQREKTASLLVGGYVDAHFSGEMEQFVRDNPEIYTRKGELRAELKQAETIIERIEREPLAMRMLDGEKQKIVTGVIGGLPFKAKLDVWLDRGKVKKIAQDYPSMTELLFADGAIVDMKVMKDFAPLYKEEQGRLNFISYWQYDLQLACYQRLIEQQIGSKVPCYILAATKEKVPDLELYRIPQHDMDTALELLMDKLPEIDRVKRGEVEPERCGRCEWCRMTKRLTGATWFDEA